MMESSVDTLRRIAVHLPGECAPRLFLDNYAALDFLADRFGMLTTLKDIKKSGVLIWPYYAKIAGRHDAG